MRCLSFHDSPRRAHSVAAQGGINAAKNYQNDGDSVERLFHDTLEGGDFRSRESNVYRLAELSARIIDHARRAGRAVRARVRRPARQPLVRRRAGLAHVLRARADRPAAAARRLPGAGQGGGGGRRHDAAAARDARPDRGRRSGARGRRARSGDGRAGDAPRPTRWCWPPAATPTCTSSPPTPRPRTPRPSGARTSAARRSPTRASSSSIPTCLPAARRAPGQAHAHVGVAAQRRPALGADAAGRRPPARGRSPKPSATTSSSAAIRATAISCRATWRSRAAKALCDEGRGVGPGGRGVYLDLRDAARRARRRRAARALRQPLRDVPAHHRRRSAARRRCASPPPRTTRWAGCGSTTTS